MGPVEASVRVLVADLGAVGPLAALALSLAAQVDDAGPREVAGVARELRATLAALEGSHGGDDDLAARLSTPVGDVEDVVAPVVRGGRRRGS